MNFIPEYWYSGMKFNDKIQYFLLFQINALKKQAEYHYFTSYEYISFADILNSVSYYVSNKDILET